MRGAPVPGSMRYRVPRARVPGRRVPRTIAVAICVPARGNSCVGSSSCRDVKGGSPHQPDFGARHRSYRCSLPGLTGFTTSRREGADTDCHGKELADRVGFEPTNTVRCYLLSKQAPSTARPPVRDPLLPCDGPHGVRMITTCYCGFWGSAVGVENGGGVSRQGSSLPRGRSGVFSGGTFNALRVSGGSRPGGACRGGSSCAPA